MNRVAIFAHFDDEREIKPYVVYYLERLRQECSRIVFVSTSPLEKAETDKLRPYADTVLLKDNVGWDFGMWRHALEHVDVGRCSELVLTNSSLFGPVHPLGPIFRRMTEDPCDFWGMTDNFEIRWHLQSYFLVLKRPVLVSDTFPLFWNSVLPYRGKGQVVLSYEIGLTSFLLDSGFAPAAFVPIESWASWMEQRRMDLGRRWNPTLFYPDKLLSLGMPFVKAMLLRDNVGNVPLDPVYRAMAQAGYDLNLVQFDRTPPKRDRRLRARVRRVWRRFAEDSGESAALSARARPAPQRPAPQGM
jgi:lipopolysaccharide biosynthesis protein